MQILGDVVLQEIARRDNSKASPTIPTINSQSPGRRQRRPSQVHSSASLASILNPQLPEDKPSTNQLNLTNLTQTNIIPHHMRRELPLIPSTSLIESREPVRNPFSKSSSLANILNEPVPETKPSVSQTKFSKVTPKKSILEPIKQEKLSEASIFGNNSLANILQNQKQSVTPESVMPSAPLIIPTNSSTAADSQPNIKSLHGMNSPLSSPRNSTSQDEPEIKSPPIPETDYSKLKEENEALKNYCPTSTPIRIPISQKISTSYLPSNQCYSQPSKNSKFSYNSETHRESYIRAKYPNKFKTPQIEDLMTIGIEGIMKAVEDVVYSRGEPLIVKNFHKVGNFNQKLFSLKNLENQFDESINVVDPTTRLRERMSFTDFLNYCRKEGESMDSLYAKDLEAPHEWTEAIKRYIPEELHYNGSFDLMGYLINDLKSPNIEIYVGKGGTYTPFHIDVCGSQGHNLMVATENDASSLWIMAGAQDVHSARRYIDENSSEELSSDLDNTMLNLEQMSNFPSRFFLFEQNLGDFVFVPSQSMHSVINLGAGLTTKLSWNITTPKSLFHTITHFSPLYRSIFKGESYRNKAMVFHTFEKWSASLRKTPRKQTIEQKNCIVENFPIIHSLLSNMVVQEYYPNSHTYQNLPIRELKEKYPFKRTCDFCKSDIFNTFLASIKPTAQSIPQSAYTMCLNCVSEGRFLAPQKSEDLTFVYTKKSDYYLDLLNTSADYFNTYIESNDINAEEIEELDSEDLDKVYENFNTMKIAMDRAYIRLFENDKLCTYCKSDTNGEHLTCSMAECDEIQCHKCIDRDNRCFIDLNSTSFKCTKCINSGTKLIPQEESSIPNYHLTTMNYKYRLSLDKNLYSNPLLIPYNVPSFYDRDYLSVPEPSRKKRAADDDSKSLESNTTKAQKAPKTKKPKMPKEKSTPKVQSSTTPKESKTEVQNHEPEHQVDNPQTDKEPKVFPKSPKTPKTPKAKVSKIAQSNKKRPLNEDLQSPKKATKVENTPIKEASKLKSQVKGAKKSNSQPSSAKSAIPIIDQTQCNLINQQPDTTQPATNLFSTQNSSQLSIVNEDQLATNQNTTTIDYESDSSTLSTLTDISSDS
jgi:hypothetical protein